MAATSESWHPATDNLAGTDVYDDGNGTFSIDFESTVADWNQILLSTGDGVHWMIFDKSQLAVTGSNTPMTILASSISASPYEVNFYNRTNCCSEDPWLSINDHFGPLGNYAFNSDDEGHSMLYGENSFTGWDHWRENHDGADVFIRNSAAIPEPSLIALFGAGLAAFGFNRRRRLEA